MSVAREAPGRRAFRTLPVIGLLVCGPWLGSMASTEEPAPPPALRLSIEEAVLLVLEHNASLSVERLNPRRLETFERQEQAVFDPVLTGEALAGQERQSPPDQAHEDSTSLQVAAGMKKLEPTGTTLGMDVTAARGTTNLLGDQHVTRLGLTLNQALMQGASVDANLAAVRQARVDTEASEYELRGFTESLVAEVETTYWNMVLARRTIEIVTNSVALAEQQLRETQERIKVGILAETETAAGEAELARRQENLINARSALQVTSLHLSRLLSLPTEALSEREIEPTTAPVVPEAALDPVTTYIDVARRMRAEINQAKLGLQRGDLELVKTRNGLLPRLDLFITLGKSGYAESFGTSVGNLTRHDYDVMAGVRFEYPSLNRAAEARHERAMVSRQQAELALDNLEQLVEEDVRGAYIEVNRSREQIAATGATRRFEEATLRVEMEKFRVGRSTSFLVSQAQRDLLESQVTEVSAVVGYLKALTQLHLQQGALLERRGIQAPGATPVSLDEPVSRP